MVLDTAMLSAPKVNGLALDPAFQDRMVCAVLRWISGRPTEKLRLSPLTHARKLAISPAKVKTAVGTASARRAAVPSTLTRLEITTSMVKVAISLLTPLSHSQLLLNSSQMMELTTVT